MTTLLALVRGGHAVMGADGQVTVGSTVQKHGAVKVRSLREGRVLAGFAGGAADALALLDRLETKLDSAGGNLLKAAVELAKDWRADRVLRRLEAVAILADPQTLLLVSGTGDVITPDDGILAAGSGGGYAAAAARALVRHGSLGPRETCEAALKIAAEIDVYTNDRITILETRSDPPAAGPAR
jgi:ATP-dependent HslUV protease subunit HslV